MQPLQFGGVVFYALRNGTNGEIMTLHADVVRPGKPATKASGITRGIEENEVVAGHGFLREGEDSYKNGRCDESTDITEECFPPECDKAKIPERGRGISLFSALISKWWGMNAAIAPVNEQERIDVALEGSSRNRKSFAIKAAGDDVVCFDLTVRSVYP